MPVPEELVELLRCLECGSQLDEDGAVLVCRSCRLRYPIEGDIPVMLIDAARRGDTA